ncbi:hypothetical protein C8R43DRAFT_952281 [Mycena crocata]|nr:hypothetical protein C8R43DRAFT_952281 [Mycena crocata]
MASGSYENLNIALPSPDKLTTDNLVLHNLILHEPNTTLRQSDGYDNKSLEDSRCALHGSDSGGTPHGLPIGCELWITPSGTPVYVDRNKCEMSWIHSYKKRVALPERWDQRRNAKTSKYYYIGSYTQDDDVGRPVDVNGPHMREVIQRTEKGMTRTVDECAEDMLPCLHFATKNRIFIRKKIAKQRKFTDRAQIVLIVWTRIVNILTIVTRLEQTQPDHVIWFWDSWEMG